MTAKLRARKTGSQAVRSIAVSDITNDVRMDGVSFFRSFATGPFDKVLDPGHFSYCVMVRRGRMRLTVEFPSFLAIDLEPGDIVGISGLAPHLLQSVPKAEGLAPRIFERVPISEPPDPHCDVELIIGVAPSESIALSNMILGPIYLSPSSSPACAARIWKAAELLEEEFTGAGQEFSQAIVVRRIAEIILINMTRAMLLTREAEDGAIPLMRTSGGILAAIRAFLTEPLDDWSVGKLARAAGMSRTKFAEEFRREMGNTPMQTLGRVRLAVIARKLIADELSVDEAADMMGYSSSAAFIRAFSREFGATPLQWRKMHMSRIAST